MKKDGKITLEPTFLQADSFEAELKDGKPFYFRIKIAEVCSANLVIKVELRTHEEVEQAAKHLSRTLTEASVDHISIPF